MGFLIHYRHLAVLGKPESESRRSMCMSPRRSLKGADSSRFSLRSQSSSLRRFGLPIGLKIGKTLHHVTVSSRSQAGYDQATSKINTELELMIGADPFVGDLDPSRAVSTLWENLLRQGMPIASGLPVSSGSHNKGTAPLERDKKLMGATKLAQGGVACSMSHKDRGGTGEPEIIVQKSAAIRSHPRSEVAEIDFARVRAM